jgi:hypothetical protein
VKDQPEATLLNHTMGRYMVILLETLQETQSKAEKDKQNYIFLIKQTCFKECNHTPKDMLASKSYRRFQRRMKEEKNEVKITNVTKKLPSFF